MAQFAHFTTDGVAPPDRLARWDADLWTPVAPFKTHTMSGGFDGDASAVAVGPLYLVQIAATAHRLELREGAGVAPGLIQLIVQRRGIATIAQCGRTAELQPGAWALCDTTRSFSLGSAGFGEQLILLIPRDRLNIGGSLTAHFARSFGQTGGTARLLPNYLFGLLDEIEGVDESNCGELADMAAQLVRLALFEARHTAPAISMRETMKLRVKDYVRRNLRDPALSIDRVAASFGCTKRHLHKVFSGEETTLSQFIWSQRLECCREALRNPQLARFSITEIAFMWGFNNSAHFSKTFKERFGLPPGSFRERNALHPRDIGESCSRAPALAC